MPCENHGNHEHHKIPYENHQNHENHRIPCENQETIRNHKFSCKKIKIMNPKIPIVSTYQKRLELSHIEDMIESLSVVPDFGYPINSI